jgi:hypothetical protein
VSAELITLLREMDGVQQETDGDGGAEVAWYYYRARVATLLGVPESDLICPPGSDKEGDR